MAHNNDLSLLEVSLCYGQNVPESAPVLQTLKVATGTTIAQIIQASGILQQYPEIDWEKLQNGKHTGIFSKLRPLDTVLQQGDRVEIYAPLLADPKAARHKRVAHTRVAGSKEGVRWLRGRVKKNENQ